MAEETTTNEPKGTATAGPDATKNGNFNSRQYEKHIGPENMDIVYRKSENMTQQEADKANLRHYRTVNDPAGKMAKPVEEKYSQSGNASSIPYKKPETREKIVREGERPSGIRGHINSMSEAYQRGRDGKVHSDFMPEETAKLNNLIKERANTKDSAEIKLLDEEISKTRKALEPKATKFGELNIGQKTAAKIGGNIGQAGAMEKGLRFGGAAVGLGAIISGTKQLVSPEVDENGESKSGVGKQLGKIAGGAAIVYASLVHGGANKAMGLVRS